MVLILSYDGYEQGTEGVIDWLLYYGHPFVRASANALLRPGSDWKLGIHDGQIEFKGVNLNNEVGAIFFRRFEAEVPYFDIGDPVTSRQLQQELRGEAERLTEFVADSLADKFWLPTIEASNRAANKLSTLTLARTCGLAVPKSYVCRSRAEVINLLDENPLGWITKPIEYCGYYSRKDYAYTTFTSKLGRDNVAELPERFHPSLLQQCVTPVYEVRTFYLMGEFFSEATQTEGSTTNLNDTVFVDIKLKNTDVETRYLPYQLPIEIEEKLDLLMRKLDLNTGSIDLLVNETGEYYFLEVNPGGQFSAPSERENFHLEKRVAEILIKKDNEYGK
jgi:glutathione synthase/RimK-type ligase-like ATP-grasp enzyme